MTRDEKKPQNLQISYSQFSKNKFPSVIINPLQRSIFTFKEIIFNLNFEHKWANFENNVRKTMCQS